MINNHTISFYGTVVEGRLLNLHCGQTNLATYDVTMSDLSALKLTTSKKPIVAFVELMNAGDIKLITTEPPLLQRAEELASADNEPIPKSIRNFFGQFIENQK